MPSATEIDSRRRLALQLAIQLPQNVAEAREVLALATELLDGFMVEPSAAQRRAKLLGWGVRPAIAPARPQPAAWWMPHIRIAGWSLLVLALSTLAGLGLFAEFKIGAGMTNAIGVTVVALLFGTGPALGFSWAAALLFNLVIIPPALTFQPPIWQEGIAFGAYSVLSVLVPWLVARRQKIRDIALPSLRLVAVSEPEREAISASG